MDKIEELKSVIHTELFGDIGEYVERTVDIRTDCGYILLCGDDSVVKSDYKKITNEFQPEILIVE